MLESGRAFFAGMVLLRVEEIGGKSTTIRGGFSRANVAGFRTALPSKEIAMFPSACTLAAIDISLCLNDISFSAAKAFI